VEPLDLLRELRKLKPTVVHFSGRGGCGKPGGTGGAGPHQDVVGEPSVLDRDHQHGLFFQGPDGSPTLVSSTALEETFGAAGSSVKVIVLNACYSEMQAEALLAHIDCIVGIGGSIRDAAARNFAIGFYGGLGECESVAAAYRQGRAAISLEGLPDGERPRLKLRDGIDAERLVLAEDQHVQSAFGQGPVGNESLGLAENRTPMLADRAGVPSVTVSLQSSKHLACPSPPIRADVKGESTKVVVVFQATMREFDAQVIARVTDELQRLTGDLTVRVLRVEEGSVRLILKMSNDAARKLLQMQRDGKLDDICEFRVIETAEIASSDDEYNQDNISASENPIHSFRPSVAHIEIGNALMSTAEGSAKLALEQLPILPLPNVVLLPGSLLPLHVFEKRHRDIARDCLAGQQLMGVARLRPGFESSYYGRPPVYEKCGVGRIIHSKELPDGRIELMLRGVARAVIVRELPSERDHRLVEARVVDDASYDPVDAHDHLHQLIKLCDRLAAVIPQGGSELRDLVRTFDMPGACADAVAAALVMDADARQELLETRDPMIRLQRTLGHVSHLLCELAPTKGSLN
jgi:Lon protease-like protein